MDATARLRTLSALLTVTAAGCAADGGDEVGGGMNPPVESISDGTTDQLTAKVEVAFKGGPGALGLAATEVADGWTVTYTKFLVAVGTFEFSRPGATEVEYEQLAVIDLLAANAEVVLGEAAIYSGVSELSFTLPPASSRFQPVAPATDDDRDLMADGGYALYVEGTIGREDGLTCIGQDPPLCTPAPTIAFAWGITGGAKITDCPPVVVDDDDVVDRVLELPGDRWFRTNFNVAGAAPPIRRAQWIADADANRDGETTLDELAKLPASVAFPAKLGFDVRTGAPLKVTTARDYVLGQALLLGRDALGCGSVTAL